MQKTYGFLLLMVLLMPSLGLGAVSIFLENLVSKDHPNEAVDRFECIFLADNGSFFVNYIIFAAFLGTALELLRIPELLNFGIRLFFTSSAAERNNVKRKRTFEFEFGLHYAWDCGSNFLDFFGGFLFFFLKITKKFVLYRPRKFIFYGTIQNTFLIFGECQNYKKYH